MTNNPLKVKALSKIGIKIIDRLPIKVGHNDYNAKYLATKAGKLGHIFSRDTLSGVVFFSGVPQVQFLNNLL